MSTGYSRFAQLLLILGAAVTTFAAYGQSPNVVPRQDVTLRLDWIPTWYHVPFYYALDRGFYRDAGLNVTIGQGKGSTTTAQVVAAGSETFGLVDLSTMMLAVASGAPLKAIGGLIQRSPESVVFIAPTNIKSPKDLEGKRWGYTAGSSGETLFSLFAAKAGVDESKIGKITMEPAAKLTFLLGGRVDFVTDWGVTVNPLIAAQGKTPGNLVYADYGVHFIASSLVTNTSNITNKPDLVKAFMAATVKGIEGATKNPAMAVDALIAHQSVVANNRDQFIGQMKLFEQFLHSEASAGKATLWMAPDDIASTLEVAKRLRPTAESLQANNLFTNEFLPTQ